MRLADVTFAKGRQSVGLALQGLPGEVADTVIEADLEDVRVAEANEAEGVVVLVAEVDTVDVVVRELDADDVVVPDCVRDAVKVPVALTDVVDVPDGTTATNELHRTPKNPLEPE